MFLKRSRPFKRFLPRFRMVCSREIFISEENLPENWHNINIEGYSRESKYYSKGGDLKCANEKVERIIADICVINKYRNLLDVGVGDGKRLLNISNIVQKNSRIQPVLYGIDLSEKMLKIAEASGINTTKHDMRKPLPDFGTKMDLILYLSGSLGYIMNREHGAELRVRALNFAYNCLEKGGRLILESIVLDNLKNKEVVSCFERYPLWTLGPIKCKMGSVVQHFMRWFKSSEIINLIKRSKFSENRIKVTYILHESYKEKPGKIVHQEGLKPYNTYRLLLSVKKQ